MKQKETKKFPIGETTAVCIIGFIAAIVLIAVDEILDIPALVFHAAPTPINWMEIGIEAFYIFIIGVFVISAIYWLDSKRKQAESSLKKVNRTLETLSECNQILVRAADEPDLLHNICRAILEFGGYRLAWIGFIDKDEDKSMQPVAQSGFDEAYLNAISVTGDDTERVRSPVGTAIRTGEPCIVNDVLASQEFISLHPEAAKYGYKSLIVLPLYADSRTIGALNVYSAEADAFNAEEVRLLTELAGDLAYGVMALRSHDERRRAEEKYTTLVERSNDGIIVIQDGLVKFTNARMMSMTGFSLEETIGISFLDFISPEYRIAASENYRKRVSGEIAPNDYEIEILAKDSHRMPVEINARRIEYEGKPADMAIIHDITERKIVAEQRAESERIYATIANNSPIGVYIVQEGRFVYVNQRFCELTGYTSDELMVMDSLDLVVQEDRDAVRVSAVKMLKNQITRPYEFRTVTKDGDVRYVMETVTSVQYKGERAVLGSYMDITESRQAEEALRQGEERYRDLFDNTNDMIQSIAPDGSILYVNEAWQTALGYTDSEIAGLKIWDIIHPDSMKHCEEVFQQVMTGENVGNIEAVFVNKDGRPIQVEGTSHCRFVAGKPASTQGIFRDITDRRKAEERITHLNSLLRALRDVNQLITRESDRERLIQQSCDILVSTRGYEKVWILLVNEERSPTSVAAAGYGEDISLFVEQMKAGQYPYCVQQLWEQRDPLLVYDEPGSRHEGCVMADRHGGRAVYRYRLEYGGKVYGALGVTLPIEVTAAAEDKDLFLELCGDISYALAAIERREERERLEEELRQSEAGLAEAQRIAHIGSWELDLVSNTLAWSDEVYRMFGLRPQQFGATYEAFLNNIHPDDREMVNKAYTESVRTKSPYNIAHRLLLKDGTVKYVNERCETFYDGEGKPVRSIGTVQDITERKKAEETLQESEQKYRTLIENVPQKIFYKDRNLVYISCNNGYARDLKIKPNEITGKTDYDFFPKDLAEKYRADDRRVIELERIEDIEEKYIEDGEERIVETFKRPVRDERGSVVGVLGIFQDITERKKMQEQLILTDRLASVGELASGIAHELNNPLTGVIGLSQLLVQGDNVPEAIREDLELVYGEAQRAANVVKNLLTFARKHTPAKELFDVNDVINKVLELRAYEEKVNNIKVVTHLAPDLSHTMADYFQLQQVFLNLIINAEYFMVEAHGKGTLTITTRCVDDMVVVSIADDGPGITEENLKHVFDPFFTTKEVGKGTGLGLSICHGIVVAHNGRISVESETGKGTEFTVELPVVRGEEAL